MGDWAGTGSSVCAEVTAQARANLEAYRVNPALLEEQVNIELAAAEGGYGRRQLYELIQNGADALIASHGGRVEVVLTGNAFYCANQGEPIDVPGVRAILLSNVSQKRGDEIGRFGLGFKSVLEVTDSPEFYSRSGSFAWNYARTKDEIAAVVKGFDAQSDSAPKLRLAWPVDPDSRFQSDEVLGELAEWATTVVKLPFHSDTAGWLGEDLRAFPQEFVLFCRHVAHLVLDDRVASAPSGDADDVPRREIHVKQLKKRGLWELVEGETSSVWTVFSTVHEPTDAAKKDAGAMSKRDRLPIHWALPLAGRTGPGVLWAFFPTEYETTLSGIVNAPWKTNPDRKNLLEGDFNREVLRVVSRLVIDSLRKVKDAKDPGRLLDLMPGRGDEARNWADRELTNGFYELAAQSPSIPDLTGNLRTPHELRLHPSLRKTGEEGRAGAQRLLAQWIAAAPDSNWCHPSVEQRERRPRVERLIRDGEGTLVGWPAWLEALVQPATVDGSAAAIKIATDALDDGFTTRAFVDVAEIVLTSAETLVAPDPRELFFAGDYDAEEDIDYVHPGLAKDAETRIALEKLGITTVDAEADLEALLRGATFSTWSASDWSDFWTVVRRLDNDRAVGVFRARRRRPFVRVRSGRFRPLQWTLLPGAIIPTDVERDRDVVVDVDYHRDDLDLLRELGAVSAPEPGRGSRDEPWFDQYRLVALVEYRGQLEGTRRRPREDLLDFLVFPSGFAGPLAALEALSEEGRALLTEAALGAEADLSPWKFGHTTQEVYPVIEVDPPTVWRLKREGYFHTSLGPRPVAKCVSPLLVDWSDLLPVAEIAPEFAERFGLATTFDDLSPDLWDDAFSLTHQIDEDALLGRFYAQACLHVRAPARIRCRVGDAHALEPAENVTVVHELRELNALTPQRVPTLLAPTPSAAEQLRTRWGLSVEEKVATTLAYGEAGEVVPLSDRFPGLQWMIEPSLSELQLVPTSELRLETFTSSGRIAEDLESHFDDGRFYFDADLSSRDLLLRLLPAVGLEPDEGVIDEILSRGADAERRRRVTEIRQQPTLEARLLAAMGDSNLRSRLPKGLLAALEEGREPMTGEQVAELALAVYGIDVLRIYKPELADQGLEPPTQWAASAAALNFVRRLGFPREFAGFVHPGRSPLLEVEGPPEVPDLHDYQRTIVNEFRGLLRREDGSRRALLSLPTGAGKTRVAVEALIEAVQRDGLRGPILWVTQSDELCEQAVQTWSFVWRGIGPSRARLAVSRLWSTNEAEPVEGSALQVVVATIQKLDSGVFENSDYDWLANAGCVVVDEAHHAVAPTYTELLEWVGLGGGRGTRPLIGLTATPFRGVSEDETKRLVARYGRTRLDASAFGDEDPYTILQDRGILARVRHRVLGGVEIELTSKELRMLERTRLFPRSAEDRLGVDVERNRRILEEVRKLPDDWTVLLFATSVDHAQTMAALMTLEGIAAKPITGLTESGPRRHYIEEFREGRLRVLTNYAVLTQGFDAPAVRAIFVTRPTYSPNLYQQMIGRGLRGPLNGGKDECLIVNVEDNIRQFGERLAFRDFEYLWGSD